MLNPEEILYGPYGDEALERRINYALEPTRAFFILLVGIAACFTLFVISGMLSVNEYKNYVAQAFRNVDRIYLYPAPRGEIFDRNGVKLVENIPKYNIILDARNLPVLPNEREEVISEINAILEKIDGADTRLLDQRVDKTENIVALNISEDKFLAVKDKIINVPGILIEKIYQRNYIFGELLAHILGYTGLPTSDDFMRIDNLHPREYIGKAGVEYSYDHFLRGKPGEKVYETDARGEIRRLVKESSFEPGQDLYLTVDVNLQKAMSEALAKRMRELGLKRAAAVALNPKNGEVLAMVSLPSYNDNNIDINAINENPNRPLFNRALSGLYSPGSTIKPFLAVAALEERLITPNTTVFSNGSVIVPNPYDPDHPSIFRDWRQDGHGVVNLKKAIYDSVNTYFYAIGGGYKNQEGLGISRIKKYLSIFGFGRQTGIDIAGEAKGFVPDQGWKVINNPIDPVWRIGDTYNVSIGQGATLVTPLQLARSIGALATGKLVRPHLVMRKEKDYSDSLPIREDSLQPVRAGMRAVVTDGSAKLLDSLPVAAAGKTGTAQYLTPGGEKINAIFTAYASIENPEIVVSVFVEDGGFGTQAAVPVAYEILKRYYSP